MKKQIFRVKQQLDQTFLGAEKSEVLNHKELQIADQRVEFLRTAITAISKKIAPNGAFNDKEKRMKKCLEYQLGSIFVEESKEEKECALFQHILRQSGRAEQDLAKEFAEHESKVEEMVYAPFQKAVENEFPNILKQKHNLRKYCLDRDSASNRYHSTKKEALKEDMEEADSKVEQSRDALAIEMFGLLARENEFSSYVLQLLKLQRGYHESALKILETIIPELERKIGDSHIKRVFGVPLHEHLRVSGKKIAYPLEVCVTTLSELGMSEEGLFRIAAGLTKVKRLKSAIDSGCFSTLIPEYKDVHVIASTLKLYLREMPEPLLTYHLHKEWMQSMQYPENHRLEAVRHVLNKLPQENKDNLAFLIQFLARLTQHHENKMSSSNIAIVMAPNLLWNKNEEANVNMGNAMTINMLVELFIKEVSTLFPEDVSKYVSISGILPEEELYHQRLLSQARSMENIDSSMDSLLDSPRPNTRKKKPAAPVPPNNVKQDADNEKNGDQKSSSSSSSSYPSGSSTLTRPPKGREPVKMKSTIGVNTDENSFARNRSLTKDDMMKSHTHNNCNLVTGSDVETKVVKQDVADVEKNFKTTVTHQIVQQNENSSAPKPVAAPRSFVTDGHTSSSSVSATPTNLSRNSSLRNDVMSRSHNSAEFGDVQLRRTEMLDRTKPEIPARPASLAPLKRSSLDVDPTLQRTQCQVYSVANKQQPSIVNVQNRHEKFQLGHDTQIAEKERFLGHQPAPKNNTVENKFNDINSNIERNRTSSVGNNKPSVPPKCIKTNPDKSMVSKSNEKLNDFNEKNSNVQKSSHTRTRSDGNLIELGKENAATLLQTPPSPRSLNKPTQPPPPPPTANKKPEPESTDF